MDVKTKLQKIFKDSLADDQIKMFEEMISEDVEGWDSFSHINYVMEIEEEFGIKFTVDEITTIENVGELISIIERKLAK